MEKNGFLQQMLDTFYEATYLLPRPFETPYAHARRLLHYDPDRVYRGVHYLKKQGYIEVAFKQGEKFIKLTKKGQLKVLLEKASIDKTEKWDGKWRLIILISRKNAMHKERGLGSFSDRIIFTNYKLVSILARIH